MDLNGKKVMITCGGGVGDIIMYTPALRRLKEKYHCHITFYTSRNYEVIEGLPYIDEIMYVPRGVFMSKFRQLHKLRDYYAIIITDWQPNVLVAAELFNIPVRAGFVRKNKFISRFYNRKLTYKWHKSLSYVGDNNAKMISQALGVELDGDMSRCEVSYPSVADKENVDAMLLDIGITPEQEFVILSPFTSFILKNYPEEACRELVCRINEKYNMPIVVIGGRGNFESAARISSYNLCGKTSIKEMIALISRAKLMITADSGPMHVAGAVGTPIVAVFGKEVPERWAPKRKCWPITLHYQCSPCKDDDARNCSKNVECLRKITADMVMDKIEEIWEQI